jgi:hypothetical protein
MTFTGDGYTIEVVSGRQRPLTPTHCFITDIINHPSPLRVTISHAIPWISSPFRGVSTIYQKRKIADISSTPDKVRISKCITFIAPFDPVIEDSENHRKKPRQDKVSRFLIIS